jgi:hypothetical protein
MRHVGLQRNSVPAARDAGRREVNRFEETEGDIEERNSNYRPTVTRNAR